MKNEKKIVFLKFVLVKKKIVMKKLRRMFRVPMRYISAGPASRAAS